MGKRTRIILSVGMVGRTFASNHYRNVYDFDQHTVMYKELAGMEGVSDEVFKTLPACTVSAPWIESYMQSFCDIIEAQKHDVVLGWLHEDCIRYLTERNYDFEVLLVRPYDELMLTYHKRAQQMGLSDSEWLYHLNHYKDTYYTYREDSRPKQVWVLQSDMHLSTFLMATGSVLLQAFGSTLPESIYELVSYDIEQIPLSFPSDLVPLSTQLVLTQIYAYYGDCTIEEDWVCPCEINPQMILANLELWDFLMRSPVKYNVYRDAPNILKWDVKARCKALQKIVDKYGRQMASITQYRDGQYEPVLWLCD